MADPIETEKWVLIESEPLAGLAPTTTFYETRNAAKIYANPRLAAFGRLDLARVMYRRTVETVITPVVLEDA